ncbi:hypothetical protein HAX54_039414, partial [Datura stramonium]|nr:hypothetical protein [Datura stramonium]
MTVRVTCHHKPDGPSSLLPGLNKGPENLSLGNGCRDWLLQARRSIAISVTLELKRAKTRRDR